MSSENTIGTNERCTVYRITAEPKDSAEFRKLFQDLPVDITAAGTCAEISAKPKVASKMFVFVTYDEQRKGHIRIGDGEQSIDSLQIKMVETTGYQARIVLIHAEKNGLVVRVTCKADNAESKLVDKNVLKDAVTRAEAAFKEARLLEVKKPPMAVPSKPAVALQVATPTVPVDSITRPTPVVTRGLEKLAKVQPKKQTAASVAMMPSEKKLVVHMSAANASQENKEDVCLEWVLVDEVMPLEGQPREEFDPKDLESLGQSMLHGKQRQLITVRPEKGMGQIRWELVDGERRWRAAKQVGIKRLFALVRKYNDTDAQYWDSLIMNLQRKGHTHLELSDAFAKALKSGKTVLEICQGTGYTDAFVYQHLRLQSLHPELKQLLRQSTPKPDRLRMALAYEFARLPDQNEQLRIYNDPTVRGEPNLGKRNRNARKLLKPILEKLPRKGRKLRPVDYIRAIDRALNRIGDAAAYLEGLPAKVVASILKSDALDLDLVGMTNAVLLQLEAFKKELIRQRALNRKLK